MASKILLLPHAPYLQDILDDQEFLHVYAKQNYLCQII